MKTAAFSIPCNTLIKECQGSVGVGHETPLFDELGEHLGLHQHGVELVVVAVSRLEEADLVEELVAVGGSHRRRRRDRLQELAVTSQRLHKEVEKSFSNLHLKLELLSLHLEDQKVLFNLWTKVYFSNPHS